MSSPARPSVEVRHLNSYCCHLPSAAHRLRQPQHYIIVHVWLCFDVLIICMVKWLMVIKNNPMYVWYEFPVQELYLISLFVYFVIQLSRLVNSEMLFFLIVSHLSVVTEIQDVLICQYAFGFFITQQFPQRNWHSSGCSIVVRASKCCLNHVSGGFIPLRGIDLLSSEETSLRRE